MRALLFALVLLSATPVLAQSLGRSSDTYIMLHLRALIEVEPGALPAVPAEVAENRAVTYVELKPSGGSSFWLDAEFYFQSLDAYDEWRQSDATETMMAVLQEAGGGVQARLVVGAQALLDHRRETD